MNFIGSCRVSSILVTVLDGGFGFASIPVTGRVFYSFSVVYSVPISAYFISIENFLILQILY